MNKNNGRLLSIDATRGFDMLFIMGMSGVIGAICELFPGGADCWLANQMYHVDWHGFRHHDTIFALFLFISGMTYPFSLEKKRNNGKSNAAITLDIIKRGLILFGLGLIYGGILDFNFSTCRIPSVLGRIGFAWMFAALIYTFTGSKVQWSIAGSILIGYYLLMRFCIAPDAPAGADHFSLEGNIVSYFDRLIMSNHILSKGVYDPEGILSTIPAIVTALLGMFTGRYVKESDDSGNSKTIKMLAAAAIMAVIAIIWNQWFPVNKKLWTSTFVLAAGAWSVGIFALFYYLIDVKGWRKGVVFFQVVGMNSITIYMAMRIVSFPSISKFFLGGLASVLPANVGSLILQLGTVAAGWLFLWFLYKKNCFLKV